MPLSQADGQQAAIEDGGVVLESQKEYFATTQQKCGKMQHCQAILSSSWTVRRPAPMKPALLGRTEAKRELLEYIRGAMDVAATRLRAAF